MPKPDFAAIAAQIRERAQARGKSVLNSEPPAPPKPEPVEDPRPQPVEAPSTPPVEVSDDLVGTGLLDDILAVQDSETADSGVVPERRTSEAESTVLSCVRDLRHSTQTRTKPWTSPDGKDHRLFSVYRENGSRKPYDIICLSARKARHILAHLPELVAFVREHS